MALDEYTFGADLLEAVQSRANQLVSSSDDYVLDTKAYVRRAYWDVLAAARWPWALASRPGVLVLNASIPVSILSIVGTTATLTTSPTLSYAGRKLVMNGNNAWYRVIAHTAGTPALTLDAPYQETITSGAGSIFQDEYALDKTVLTLHGPFRPRNGAMWWHIPLLPEPEFRAKYGTSFPVGPGPTEAAMLIRSADLPTGEDASHFGPAPQVQVAPWPMENMVVEFDYTPWHYLTLDRAKPGDYADPTMHDVPTVPRGWRHAIIDRATYFLLLDKKDQNADAYNTLANATIAQMIRKFLPADREQFWTRPRNSLSLGCY